MITLTQNEWQKLTDDIQKAGHTRSLAAYKGDVLKFVLAYFDKQAKAGTNPSKKPSKKKETSEEKEDKQTFKVKTVNGDTYKHSTSASASEPISAARIMAPKIASKVGLEKFTFQIQEKESKVVRTYIFDGNDVTTSSTTE